LSESVTRVESVAGPLDTRTLRAAFGAFATGVTVVTAIKPTGEAAGVTANSFTSVSLDPPLVLWCLQNSSTSLAAFTKDRRFSINMLAAHQGHVAMQFAGKAPAKFPNMPLLDPDGPPPRLVGGLCRLDCVAVDVYPAGDHRIIVGRVTGLEQGSGEPLCFHGGRFGRFEVDPGSREVTTWESHADEWY
jgi:flavin reductase (DIM6/NTAB) family NADH-FMN oxidoreductase RutF